MLDHDDALEEVLSEQRDAIRLLTLNRPDRLNAWTPSMQRRYFDLLEQSDRDPAVRAIVVTGSGRAFCAGADPAVLAESGNGPGDTHGRPLSLPLRIRTPVIAAINGPVAGIGLITALFTDVRFTATEATVTTAFSRRSLLNESGLCWLLPKLTGAGTALDLVHSARTLSGTEACDLGLADRVLPQHDVLGAALAYARTLATEYSAEALAEIKQQIYTCLDQPEIALGEAYTDMVTDFSGPSVAEETSWYQERRRAGFPPLNG